MKKFLSLVTAAAMLVSATAALADTVTAVCDGSATYKVEAEMRDGDFDGNYYFGQFFDGELKEGISALIAAGAVSINDIALPTSTEGMIAQADGTFAYNTNGQAAFTVAADATEADVVAGGLEAVTSDLKKAGTNVTVTTDENGKAVAMNIFVTQGALVDSVADNGDGTVTVYVQGAPYSVGFGDAAQTVVFPAENAATAQPGLICVAWEDNTGWHMQAPDTKTGKLVSGADHEYYDFQLEDGTVEHYVDAEMYTRSFADANRPGQLTNTVINFELQDFEITACFVPGTAESEHPMLIGFVTGDNAKARLAAAIAYAQNIHDTAVLADSREAAGADACWVDDQAILDELQAGIDAAQAILDNDALLGADYDKAVYTLYIVVWGSNSDIGAVFSGTNVDGFYDKANPDVEKAGPVQLK